MSNPGPSLRGAVDLSGLVRRANTPPPTPGSTPPASTSGLVVEVNDASFQQVVELSSRVPVVVELYAAGLSPALGPIVESYGGRLVLATVDAQANPGIAEAFQVREVPAAAAIVAGRPVPLFVGTPAEEQVRQVFDQLLQVAQQNGVTGALNPNGPEAAEGDEGAEPAEPVEEPLPPAAPGGVRRHLERATTRQRSAPTSGRSPRTPATPSPSPGSRRHPCCCVSTERSPTNCEKRRRMLPPRSQLSSPSPTSTSAAVTSTTPSIGCWTSSPRSTRRRRMRCAPASSNTSRSPEPTTPASPQPVVD